MPDFRFMAQRATTKEWLDLNLELAGYTVTGEDSGPGAITGIVAPADRIAVAPDGRLVLDEWSTLLYAVLDNEIEICGIVQSITWVADEQRWEIDAPGLGSYPAGMPFTRSIKEYRADPFEVVREIWDDLQSYPDGDLGVIVDSTVSPVPVGDPSPKSKPKSVPDYAWSVLEVGGGVLDGTGKPPEPGSSPTKGAKPKQDFGESAPSYEARLAVWEAEFIEATAVYMSRKDESDGYKNALATLQKQWAKSKKSLEPYTLSWWEHPDCGEEIRNLATEVPFGWKIESRFTGDDLTVEHRLRLAYPQLGKRRHDLRFVVGENVAAIPDLESDGSDFANQIVSLGKGEGKKMLRASAGARDGRLRRVAVVADKDVGSTARLRALAADEHRRRTVLGTYKQIVVLDHQNAPFRSWDIGDEILVDVDNGTSSLWHRIVAEQFEDTAADVATLTLIRSERGV